MILGAAFALSLLSGVGSAAPLRISAASSLGPVMEAAADAHEVTHGERPVITLGSSSRLAHQLEAGAQADVVALADPMWMARLERSNVVEGSTRRDFLGNRLVVVVPAANPEAVGLSGASDWRRVAMAGRSVPLGAYAREALASAGLLETLSPRLVLTENARATAALVAQGEVDAGIVYRSDAVADTRLKPTELIPANSHRPIVYPVALAVSAHPNARPFLESLTSPQLQAQFAKAGFEAVGMGKPPAVLEPLALPEVESGPPLLRSLWVAGLSLVLSLVPAVALGWLMARRQFWGKSLVSTVCLAPLVLPPVVTGYLLLGLFGQSGPLGPLMESLGIQIAFSRWGAVMAATVVGFPLMLILARQAIESVDVRYPAIAQTLGMRPLKAFWRVTLPMALPGIAAGAVLAFARALGEFGATAMLAGDQPGETRTLALAVYALVEQPQGEHAAVTLVWVSLGVSFVALMVYERLVWRQRRQAGRTQ